MRVLILGAGGMLGHKLLQRLSRSASVVGTLRRRSTAVEAIAKDADARLRADVDVAAPGVLETLLEEERPDAVLNCVGVIKQRAAAADPVESIRINSLLPHELAAHAARRGFRLVHFSTDCVFSGHAGGYREGDPSDAEDLYGRSKYLGEVSGPRCLTLRTSIIGRELSASASLIEWFLAQRGKTVRGFTRHIYTGLTTVHMAALVETLLKDRKHLHGLLQPTAPKISKYELLLLAREHYRVDVEIVPDHGPVCDRSLDGSTFDAVLGRKPPDWRELMSEMSNDPTPYERLRREQTL